MYWVLQFVLEADTTESWWVKHIVGICFKCLLLSRRGLVYSGFIIFLN